MQDNSDYGKSYNYFVNFIREALREALFSLDVITDERVRQVVHDEVNLLLSAKQNDDLFISSPKLFSKKVFSTNIGWLKRDKALVNFHSILISYGFIATDFETFLSHFKGTGMTGKPLIWLSQKNHLVYLFNQLMVSGIIPRHKNLHQLLAAHFIDKNGNKLKNGSLRSSLNQIRNNKRIIIIDEIIERIDAT